MTDSISTVLLAGIGRGSLETIAPVLDRRHLTVIHSDSPEEAVALASEKKFDLVIFDAAPVQLTLADLVGQLRDEASASCRCSLLVVAEKTAAEKARDLVGHGVNRVVTLDDPEETIEKHVADLLDIAPRASVRFTTRLTFILANATLEVEGYTTNASVSGMFLQTPTKIDPGQEVVFEFWADERGDLVSGRAETVRCAAADREGVDGIGVRFLDFDGDGRERMAAVLTEALVNS